MPDLRELEQKLDSSRALQEIVQAMRNLAAIYVRRAEATLDAIRPYSDTTATALGDVLERTGTVAGQHEGADRCMVVALTGDQGLCGTYNEKVARAVETYRNALADATSLDVVVLGQRGRDLLRLRGIEPALFIPSPSSLEGIRARMPQIAIDIFSFYLEQGAGQLVFIYNAYEGMGHFSEQIRPVLPPERELLEARLDPPFQVEPLLTAPAEELLGAMIDEYFFIELYRAVLESHASENGARLLSMTAASSNIDERLADLTQAYQTVRQGAITAELLDVVGGAEALR